MSVSKLFPKSLNHFLITIIYKITFIHILTLKVNKKIFDLFNTELMKIFLAETSSLSHKSFRYFNCYLY